MKIPHKVNLIANDLKFCLKRKQSEFYYQCFEFYLRTEPIDRLSLPFRLSDVMSIWLLSLWLTMSYPICYQIEYLILFKPISEKALKICVSDLWFTSQINLLLRKIRIMLLNKVQGLSRNATLEMLLKGRLQGNETQI